MVYLTALWLPILISAVLVFVASSVLHMLLTYHQHDHTKLPDEGNLLAAMRKAGVGPGNYRFPCPASMKDMSSPEMMEKYKAGPVGLMHVVPSGPPAMPKYLAMWFAYCVLVGFLVAYLTGRTLATGASYLAVFRVAGTTAFIAYAVGGIQDSIWRGQLWSTTIKHVVDGLVYALLTAGVFGWLWPR
ncbi:MAG TPA: hypothetical protein VGC53_19560 [Vicinamibacteria bacterium]|jgi:hypothetical protein